jgi:GT2 family glycosyltransferase
VSLAPLVDEGCEVVVVDNASGDDRTERVVRDQNRPVRYVREDRAGLSWARRCGIAEARGELVAFVDDDVRVDGAWAQALVAAFAEVDVMGVLGLVAPAELDTRAQQDFEWHGGFGRGFDRRWLRRARGQPVEAALANTGTFGTGANMAFRRAVFSEVGPFDTALGAGTLAQGGEDLDMIFRVLEAGHTIVYEPSALVWHRHRREHAELRAQFVSWGRGMSAHLARSWVAYPHARRGLLTLAAQLLCLYHPRRVVQAVFDRRLRVSLTIAEWYGAWTGARRYLTAARTAEAAPRGRTRSAGPVLGSVDGAPPPHVVVDLDIPLPDVIPTPPAAGAVVIDVVRGSQSIGHVNVATDGRPLSRLRLVDAVVAALDVQRLDPGGAIRRALRTTLTGVSQ